MDICRRQFTKILASGAAGAVLARALNRPKLLVLVILEQFRGDYLDAILDRLGTGGLQRLLYHSSHFPDCRNLASTFTASSIATLATGAWPSQHGIVADLWFDKTSKAPVRASSELLLAPTLGAQV